MSASQPKPGRVTYVGHATVLIELDQTRLLTDPVLRRRIGHLRRHGAPPPREITTSLDGVLISHLHHDHVDTPSLREIEPDTPILTPRGAGRFLERRGFSAVQEVSPGETATIGDLRITAVEATHGGGRWPAAKDASAVGFDVSGERRVYFAGDTDLFAGMEDLAGDLDLALLPVWGWGPQIGPGHLDPERAARAAAILEPRIAIPIHWGTFFPIGLSRIRSRLLTDPPHDFARRTAELAPSVEVRVLSPGESTELPA